MAQVELTRTYVTYQAQTKLLELATEIAEIRNINKAEVKEKIVLATKIRLWLKALQYYAYLEKNAIDKLVYCLADLCDANALPYSPQITTVEQPDLIIGGSTSVTNITSSDFTDWSNLDVDIGTEVLDSFAVTLARGAVWYYTARNGVNQRSGMVIGSWLADGSSVVYSEDSTEDIGDTSQVTLSVDYSASLIRLNATVTSNDWIIEGSRLLING